MCNQSAICIIHKRLKLLFLQLEVTPCLLSSTSDYTSSVDMGMKAYDVRNRTVWSLP